MDPTATTRSAKTKLVLDSARQSSAVWHVLLIDWRKMMEEKRSVIDCTVPLGVIA